MRPQTHTGIQHDVLGEQADLLDQALNRPPYIPPPDMDTADQLEELAIQNGGQP